VHALAADSFISGHLRSSIILKVNLGVDPSLMLCQEFAVKIKQVRFLHKLFHSNSRSPILQRQQNVMRLTDDIPLLRYLPRMTVSQSHVCPCLRTKRVRFSNVPAYPTRYRNPCQVFLLD